MPENSRSSLSADVFWAHSPRPGRSDGHLLFDHLRSTAERARHFAAAFDSGEHAYLAGLCHDVGKLAEAFQRRVRGEQVDSPHSMHGARLILERYGENHVSLALALIIAGHHTGLPCLTVSAAGDRPSRSFLQRKQKAPDLGEVERALPDDFLPPGLPPLPSWLDVDPRKLKKRQRDELLRSLEMWVRFLFSALVDADFLDTGAFYAGGERPRSFSTIAELRQRLDDSVDAMVAGLDEEDRRSEVNRLRAEVLTACRDGADRAPGFFSLTVPTGGGKTLSGLSFALRHAEHHGLRRVIAAIPYTSILEQNAKVYRKHLGDAEVVEHHSALDPEGDQEDQERSEADQERTRKLHELSTENWDAPVIVTTNVQLFESLFSNRTSSCRKLHNVARSVILLDETQVLPAELLLPLLEGLRELVTHYGCTVVLTTATRPAFDARDDFPHGLSDIRELAPDAAGLARRLRRVDVEWRHREGAIEWPP